MLLIFIEFFDLLKERRPAFITAISDVKRTGDFYCMTQHTAYKMNDLKLEYNLSTLYQIIHIHRTLL